MTERLPPLNYLAECFDYHPDTGYLGWKERPLHHFFDANVYGVWNRKYAWSMALTSINSEGYRCGSVTFCGKRIDIKAHLVIWKLMTGQEPVNLIDHRDTVRTNNVWENLREATPSQNIANKGPAQRNQTGVKGVWPAEGGRFRSAIRIEGKPIHLGTFDTVEEAKAMYNFAALTHYGEYARP